MLAGERVREDAGAEAASGPATAVTDAPADDAGLSQRVAALEGLASPPTHLPEGEGSQRAAAAYRAHVRAETHREIPLSRYAELLEAENALLRIGAAAPVEGGAS
ncbi:MAG: hypothetical protein IIA41_10090 [SAR324 cluster bacterium]|nr:hypothetical protein [SAR324 cluster bacterium]